MKGPAHVLPASTLCTLQQKSDRCIFKHLRTLLSLSCTRAKIISFPFNPLRTLCQNTRGATLSGTLLPGLPHFSKPFVFTFIQTAPPATPFF
jgi:hypothetical protein